MGEGAGGGREGRGFLLVWLGLPSTHGSQPLPRPQVEGRPLVFLTLDATAGRCGWAMVLVAACAVRLGRGVGSPLGWLTSNGGPTPYLPGKQLCPSAPSAPPYPSARIRMPCPLAVHAVWNEPWSPPAWDAGTPGGLAGNHLGVAAALGCPLRPDRHAHHYGDGKCNRHLQRDRHL